MFLIHDTGFNPTNISGCQLWLKADAGITKDGSNYVSVWADQSGNGNDASQGTGTNQPLWVDATLNGKPVIRFDGNDNYLVTNDFTLNQPNTVFVVYKVNNTSGQHAIITNKYDNLLLGSHLGINATATLVYINAGIYTGIGVNSYIKSFPTTYFMNSCIFNSPNSALYENGTSKASGNVGTDSNNGFTIGCFRVGNYAYLDGDIAEIIIYNTALGTTDRQTVENYLNYKYNITGGGVSPTRFLKTPSNKVLRNHIIPTDLPGCKLWLESSMGITKDVNNYVSAWADQSGEGTNFAQTTGTYQPLQVTYVDFDGNDNYMTAGQDALDVYTCGAGKDFTICFRFKTDTTSPSAAAALFSKYWGLTENQRSYFFYLYQSKIYMDWYGNLDGSTQVGVYGSTSFNVGQWYSYIITFNSAETSTSKAQIYIDGIAEVMNVRVNTGSPTSIVDGIGQLSIGCGVNSSGLEFAYPFNGMIDKVLFYNRILTPAEITKVVNY